MTNMKIVESDKMERFAHSFIDSFAIIVLSEIVQSVLPTDYLRGELFEVILYTSLLMILVLFFYYFLTEYFLHQTISKMITNSVVVSFDGGKPSISQIFIRTICRLIPFDGLTFITSRYGLHDSLSKTRVVKKKTIPNNS